jgi:hypothetical protein
MSDWIILNDNFYTSQPSGAPTSIRLGIEYNYKTGDYQLKEQPPHNVIAPAVFFLNGSWTSDAIKDPKLFQDGDPNKPTQLAKDYALTINKVSYAAFQTRGGSAKGNKINAAAQPQNQGRFIVNNAPAGAQPGIASAFPGIGSALSAPPGQGNFLDPGLNLKDYKNFESTNEKKLFKDIGILKYPKDILENQQDTLHITMFRYRAPLEDLFEAKGFVGIFTGGVQRNSALKGGLEESIGTVILPIPAGISDSNNVEWGDDRMNNMTMAATGYVGKNLGFVGFQQALLEFANALAQKKADLNLPTGTINQAAILSGAGYNLNNPDVKAALMSLVLKNAQFNVSPESILARGAGIVPNSNLELLFRGPTLRQFQFAYRFSPRSKPEAADVRRIIRFFKQGSAARKLNATQGAGYRSVFLGSPNVFKLEYKTVGGKSIAGLNKFKICALQGVSVNYAPDGQWSAYEEGQPVSYTMSLGFQEIEPIYESDYQDNIFKNDNYDLSNDYTKITDDDIGY